MNNLTSNGIDNIPHDEDVLPISKFHTMQKDILIEREQTGFDIENFNIPQIVDLYKNVTILGHKVLTVLCNVDNTHATLNGKKTSIFIPSSSINRNIYQNCTALIVQFGEDAFKGNSFAKYTILPKIGDLILYHHSKIDIAFEDTLQNGKLKLALFEDYQLMTMILDNIIQYKA